MTDFSDELLARIAEVERRKQELKELVAAGRDAVDAEYRRFLEQGPTLNADERAAQSSEMEKLRAYWTELDKELHKKGPLVDLDVLLGRPKKPPENS